MKRAGLRTASRVIIAVVFVSTFLLNPQSNAALYTFTSHTFTTCSTTGSSGPTQASCRSAYSTIWDETDSNFTVTGGIQTWTVPISATYSIKANGAAAGPLSSLSVGLGASIQGEFTLTQGETLSILVGQRGTNLNSSYGQGGGGGSFVSKGDGTKLVIAGGGGSIGNGGGDAGVVAKTRQYADASLTTTAKNGDTYYETGGTGGSNGSAGGTSPSSYNGYPGAGFLQDAPSGGAKKYSNGMTGGIDGTYGNGGFGGGGAAGMYGGSGGGGYSGGGANSRHGPGGGGASYNSGLNKVETLTATAAEGSVVITLIAITKSSSSISLNIPNGLQFRIPSSITATTNTAGRVTFFANGKKIANCISIPTVSSGSITATCTYRPSFRGDISITAQFSPTDSSSFYSSQAIASGARVSNRASSR
jgi:hypothetical protein